MQPRRAMWIFIFTTLFVAVNDRLLFVIFPTFLIEKNFSATEIGLIFSFGAFMLVVLRTVIGRLSDRYGRKKVLSLSLLISSMTTAVYPYASRLYEFATIKSAEEISRTLKESVDESIQADAFPRKSRPEYLIKMGKAFPISRAIAAVLGIIITTYLSLVYGFYIAAISMFIAFLVFAVFYREEKSAKKKTMGKISPLAYGRKFNTIAVVGFITALVFGLMYFPAFFILAERVLGLKANDLFVFLLISYIVSAALIHFVEKRKKNFGTKSIMIGILIFFALFSFLYAFSNMFLFVVALMGIAVSYYFWRIAFKTMKMDIAKPVTRGEQLGFAKTLEGIGDILGPFIGGLLIDIFSIQTPFILGSLLYILVAIIILKSI